MHRTRQSAFRGAGACALAASLVGASLFVGIPAANAAADEIMVTNLGLDGAGSFRAALEAANASTNADGVSIRFAPELAGTGDLALSGLGVNSMYTDRVGNAAGNTSDNIGQSGARFLIDAIAPVSVDFTNLDGITDVDGSHTAGIYVASDDVTLSNLNNLLPAEAGVAVSGDNVTLDGINIEDPTSSQMEIGVALLDGADGTTILNSNLYSGYWSSIAVDTAATVTNTTVSGVDSRGVEGFAHVIFEDDAIIDGFTVAGSTFGAPGESAPSPGFYFNPNNAVTGLAIQDSTIQSPSSAALFFEGAGQTLTNTIISGNTFGGNEGAAIGRVVEDNTADWSNVTFTDNDISYAASATFRGTVEDATFSGNSFANVSDGSFPALGLRGTTSNVVVESNTFDRIWALDTVRVEGVSATGVAIENNTIDNLEASVSRSAVRIDVAGTGNTVSGNTLTQDIDDTTLPVDVDNHWAIYNSASAASADAEVGWTISGNAVDGFGGKDRSQAPIVHNGVGKLLVTGNTFGQQTRGGTEEIVEHDGYHFFWNVGDSVSNNTVQTYRAESVAYTGDVVTFTATDPDPLIGNNAATAPVTLHVYWTADDNAEEYLGAISDVTPGQTVSVSTAHTDGFIRVQTVDANGYTSQYSIIDPEAPVVTPTAPEVTETTETTVTGTATPDSTVTVRNSDGDDVTTATTDSDGEWTTDGLQCGTTYTVIQTVDGVDSEPIEFTTADCPVVVAPEAPTDITAGEDDATGTADPDGTVVVKDEDGNQVATSEVSDDGSWTVTGLECETTYTTVTVVDGVESEPIEFTTAACSTDGDGNSSTDGDGTDGTGTGDDDLAVTGGELSPTAAIAGIVLLLGGAALLFARRRQQV
ncbi:Ig-like domain-containing protein [Microbacterium halotolerans]|uniref:Ig-like domain-containing protein n=1 Tax=Microbacterium halotolerans TaxID=246613 RepID=UPI000E6AA00F|nr:Ig-like domain-containing protein [Microbacterium halotolerans]